MGDPNADKRWAGSELLVWAVLQLLLVRVVYHTDLQARAPLIPTSCWAMLLGLAGGVALCLASPSRAFEAGLNPEVLFYALLPPIVLDAGFTTHRRGFFANFGTVLLLAVVGTLVATVVTAAVLIGLGRAGLITEISPAEAMLFGSLVSATDPVATLVVFRKSRAPPLLFTLVFGESVLNDAVAIVTFTIFQRFVDTGNTHITLEAGVSMLAQLASIGVGSVALAAIVCFGSAMLLDRQDADMHRHPTYEIGVLLLSAYASYVAADVCQLSGLVAVFFSGILMRHYHVYSVSRASSSAFRHLLATLATLGENIIYLYLGLSIVVYRSAFVWDVRFAIASTAACLIARACNTFPLCAFANCTRPAQHRIPESYMTVIWYAGLRGAIAFALVLNMRSPNAALLKGATMFIVGFTTVVLGITTAPLLRALHLTGGSKSGDFENEDALSARHVDDEWPLAPSSPLASGSPNGAWARLDEHAFKVLVGGRPRSGGPEADAVDYGAIPRIA